MSYQPLHHKYRPQTFAALVGQEAIATTLTNAIITQRIAPAYLFAGPRGTGKTSSARILAKSLNCLHSQKPTANPCGECEVCRAIANGSALDVIEIDAASNTGVDNIREIIERAQFAPVQCRYKVYVIDECHMLSVAAFNALLKTLEERPERVIFVLATTDPQRVLPTIISRTQRFDFRRIPLESMVSHLKNIAEQEKIDISDEAIAIVAQIANGGLRDAQSLLDQLSLLSGKVTVERVWDLVGAVPERDLLALLRAIAANEPEKVIQQCRHLMNRGREPLIVLQNLANFYLNLAIAKTAPDRSDLVAVTSPTWKELRAEAKEWELERILQGQKQLKDSEVQIRNTTQPRLWLEVTLLGLLPSAYSTEKNDIAPTQSKVSREISPSLASSSITSPNQQSPPSLERKNSPAQIVQDNSQSQPQQLQPQQQSQPTESNSVPHSPTSEPRESISLPVPTQQQVSGEQIWQQVLKHLQPPATQALVRQHCYLISFEDLCALVGVKTKPLLKLAQDKISNIETAFAAVLGERVKVRLQVVIGDDPSSEKQPQVSLPFNSQRSTNSLKQVESISQSVSTESETPISKSRSDILDRPRQISQTKDNPAKIGLSESQATSEAAVSPSAAEPSLQEDFGSTTTNYAQDEVNRAVEIIAKFFDGEIVAIGETAKPVSSDETTYSVSSETTALSNYNAEPKLSQKHSNSSHSSKIVGRPEATTSEEEDIPFLQPVSQKNSREYLYDPWEVAAYRPGNWLHGINDIYFNTL